MAGCLCSFQVPSAATDDPPLAQLVLPDNEENLEQVLEWDRLNELVKSKLKFYITKDAYGIVWGGDDLTSLQFYRLNQMFLGRDVRSAQVLEQALA